MQSVENNLRIQTWESLLADYEVRLKDSEAKLAVAVEVIKALRAEWYLRDLQASDFEAALAQIKGDE